MISIHVRPTLTPDPHLRAILRAVTDIRQEGFLTNYHVCRDILATREGGLDSSDSGCDVLTDPDVHRVARLQQLPEPDRSQ